MQGEPQNVRHLARNSQPDAMKCRIEVTAYCRSRGPQRGGPRRRSVFRFVATKPRDHYHHYRGLPKQSKVSKVSVSISQFTGFGLG
jgi:hypothetical protein